MARTAQDEATRHLWKAVHANPLAEAKLAIEAGADVNARYAAVTSPPLHFACTPLHYAAASGATEMVELLLNNGADVTATNGFLKTAQDLAIEHGHSAIATMIDSFAKQQGHAGRVAKKRKDKGPPQVGG